MTKMTMLVLSLFLGSGVALAENPTLYVNIECKSKKGNMLFELSRGHMSTYGKNERGEYHNVDFLIGRHSDYNRDLEVSFQEEEGELISIKARGMILKARGSHLSDYHDMLNVFVDLEKKKIEYEMGCGYEGDSIVGSGTIRCDSLTYINNN